MFLNADEFNEETRNNQNFNCLAFAFGLTKEIPGGFDLMTEFDYTKLPIRRSFLWKAQDAGIKVKEVKNFSDLNGKTGFLVYGWYAYYDFHIVRVNTDGTWEHKPDYNTPACRTSEEEVAKEYPEGPAHIFVLDE